MKFLLVLAAVALALWLWRTSRPSVGSDGSKASPKARATSAPTQAMIACNLCQMHVPQAEAIAGARGHYCCEQHRQQAES
jgi:uncharacterized protein